MGLDDRGINRKLIGSRSFRGFRDWPIIDLNDNVINRNRVARNLPGNFRHEWFGDRFIRRGLGSRSMNDNVQKQLKESKYKL